jgi:hypothetical protein
MSYHSLKSVLDSQLQQLYAAELYLAKELKVLFEVAVSKEFKSQLLSHSRETQSHVEVLGELLERRKIGVPETRCKVMDALLRRASEVAQSRGDDRLLDLALIFIMRKIESYEQGAYEDAKTVAEALNESEIVSILERYIREEGQQERSWTVLAEDMVDSLGASAASTKGIEVEQRAKGVE